MTGLEKILLVIKSQAFIKGLIIFLTITVNTLLVEKPEPWIKGFIKDFLKQAVFVLLVFLVFSPALTPSLVIWLEKILPWASSEALIQLAFWIILLGSRQVIITAKQYLNNKMKNK